MSGNSETENEERSEMDAGDSDDEDVEKVGNQLESKIVIPNAAIKKPRKKGILYISSIPRYMNVAIMREMFSKYGTVGRIFLQPDIKKCIFTISIYLYLIYLIFYPFPVKDKPESKKRKTRFFTEGWLEFESKRTAKKVAEFLNNRPISNKKGNRFYDMLWTIKYLPRFKWINLSERLAYEKAVYKQKLRTEISQAKKEAQFFQNNLDLSEMLKRKKKREEKNLKKTGSVK